MTEAEGIQVLDSSETPVQLPAFRVKCAACDTWCKADAVALNEGATLHAGDNVTQLHARIELHVHDHDCALTRAILADIQAMYDIPIPTPPED